MERPAMAAAPDNRKRRAAEPAIETRRTAPGTSYRAPSREGKRTVSFCVEPDLLVELKQMALDHDLSIQSMMMEAVALLKIKYSKHPS
jgi:hypothetical protein